MTPYTVEWLDYGYNPHSKPFKSKNEAEAFAHERRISGCNDVNVFEEDV